MGNKKGRMPIPFDGDKEKKYIRLVAQPMPYGGLSFQSLPFQGESRLFPIPSSLFPCEKQARRLPYELIKRSPLTLGGLLGTVNSLN
jgi:hypothetical protein